MPQSVRPLLHDQLHVAEFSLDKHHLEQSIPESREEFAHHIELFEEGRDDFLGARLACVVQV